MFLHRPINFKCLLIHFFGVMPTAVGYIPASMRGNNVDDLRLYTKGDELRELFCVFIARLADSAELCFGEIDPAL